MSLYSANIDDFGMDSRSMAGPLQHRLDATRDAGFTQILLSVADLAQHPQGVDAAIAAVHASGLRVTGFRALADFEGLSGAMLDYKLDVAKSMLGMCHALGCRLLVLDASTARQASAESPDITRSLRQLATLAIPKNIRIAYRAHPQAAATREFAQAWDLVCLADMPNLGLCLDTLDVLCSQSSDNDLEMLDGEKLFLVQLADCLGACESGFRVFAGQGEHDAALVDMITRLRGIGFRGDYSLAVVNADYQHMPPAQVAQQAWRSALWMGQDVLQRSVPLPNQIRLKQRSIV